MVADDIASLLEPEGGKLIQHLPLERNQPQNVIEGGKTIGCDEDELIVARIDIAHFAAALRTKKVEIDASESLSQRPRVHLLSSFVRLGAANWTG